MADGEQGRPLGRVIGTEDYQAAKLRALETLVLAMAKRHEDPAWLAGLIADTETLPVNGPTWVGLWRASQLQLLNKALYGDRQLLADDNVNDDRAVQIEVDALVEDSGKLGEPFDYSRFADDTEREIARHLTDRHLDPPDLDFWRAVVAELRRRGDETIAA